MRKIFVLRPNSLLSSADSTLRFGDDNTIVIPMVVIEELQSFKGKPEKQKIAKEILEYLESFDARKLIGEGVVQSNGSLLRVVGNYEEQKADIEGINSFDRRCFQVCLGLKKDNPDVEVILVSKNVSIRIKAKILGIKAENFRDDLFPGLGEQYTGRKEIVLDNEAIDYFYKYKYLPVEMVFDYNNIDWVTNMFVIGKPLNSSQSLFGRFDGKSIVPMKHTNYPSGARPKNVGQQMLMECLLTNWKEAPLVIAKGGAGTGKTFCSLAVGLDELDKEDGAYEKILVATPFETIGQERMGYLPGDIRDKASPYLGGIRDNLSLLRGSKMGGYGKKDGVHVKENGEYYLDSERIQIQPIGFLRGRTIVDTLFIIDETQNIDPSDIKSIVTRAAEGSKFVFLGDPSQVDNPRLDERYNGLVYLPEKMKGDPLCWQVTLDETESVRGELARVAARKL